ncbi:carbohydrate sulfotransferase 11 isoform X1 [Penaeus vannamei]|uniref:carbohydrate sulfotransferase 11 isoform X1 n=1 Tax=Penaeus vannamei TaxID=6689 RepID=UPI000F65CD97|nr:carbohydrate sulfotransferase 11-like [Penaeus vannamei]
MEREHVVRLLAVCLALPSLVYYILMGSDTSTVRYHPLPTEQSSPSPPAVDSCATCDLEFDIDVGGVRADDPDELWWSDWEKVQRSRREALAYGCKHYKNLRGKSFFKLVTNRRYLYNLVIDDKHRTVYCYVPKVACTNWKRMMMILSGRTNKTDPLAIRSYVPHVEGVLPRLSSSRMTSSLLHHKLRTYTKFLFVRHPVERLVSAYRNKLVINSTSAADFKRRYGIKILKKFRKGDAVQNISKTGHGVTFAEFVSYLIEKRHESPQSMNEHWAPYVELCHPCFIKYNIIGKYETLEEDAEYVLRKIGAPPSLHFPPLVTSKTTALVEAHMNTLTPELRKKLYNAYQLDFKLFGYDYVKEKDYVTQENGS